MGEKSIKSRSKSLKLSLVYVVAKQHSVWGHKIRVTGACTIKNYCGHNFHNILMCQNVCLFYPSLIFVGKAMSLLLQWSPVRAPL